MAIVKWNPWAVSQFFDEDFTDQWEKSSMPVNLSEDDLNVYLSAQLPGIDEENIKITVEGSTVTIRAEQKEEVEEKGRKVYRKEIREQSQVRSITLPTPVSSDSAEAELKDGLLKLTLPKAEEAKPKEISLKK